MKVITMKLAGSKWRGIPWERIKQTGKWENNATSERKERPSIDFTRSHIHSKSRIHRKMTTKRFDDQALLDLFAFKHGDF